MKDIQILPLPPSTEVHADIKLWPNTLGVVVLLILIPLLAILIAIALLAIVAFMFYAKAGFAAAKFLFVLFPLGGWMFKSLRFKIPPPEGFHIRSEEYPELDLELKNLAQQIGLKKIHNVLLDGNFNASVTRANGENYLLLGIPLLYSLSKDECRAVIAHEMGHLSKSHGRLSPWIYRTHQTLIVLHQEISQNRSALSRMLEKFFSWYFPLFDKVSLPIRRAQEWEADRVSVDFTNGSIVAQALSRFYVISEIVSPRYGAKYEELVKTHAEMPNVFLTIPELIKEHCTPEKMRESLEKGIVQSTQPLDSHPSLKDRLAKIGDGAPLRTSNQEASAWDAFFGDKAESLGASFQEAYWWPKHEAFWKQTHSEELVAKEQLAYLRTLDQSNLSESDHHQLLYLIDRFEGTEAVIPLFREFLSHHQNPDAMVRFGVLLYNTRKIFPERSLEGLKWIEQGFSQKPELYLPGLASEMEDVGDIDGANRIRLHEPLFRKIEAEAIEERKSLLTSDILIPHNLPPEVESVYGQVLLKTNGVTSARIAAKKVKHFVHSPPIALFVELDVAYHGSFSLNSWRKNLTEDLAMYLGQYAPAIIIVRGSIGWKNRRELKVLRNMFIAVAPDPIVFQTKTVKSVCINFIVKGFMLFGFSMLGVALWFGVLALIEKISS